MSGVRLYFVSYEALIERAEVVEETGDFDEDVQQLPFGADPFVLIAQREEDEGRPIAQLRSHAMR